MKTNRLINIVLSFIIFIIPIIIVPKQIYDNNSLIKFILLATAGLALFILVCINYKKIRFDNIDIVLILFYILVIVSTIFSLNIKMSIIGALYRYEGLISITTYVLIYYCAKYYFKPYNKFLISFLIISTGICLYAIMQYYNIRPIYDLMSFSYNSSVASGTFGNSNFLGSFICLVFPIVLCLYILKGKSTYLIMSFIVYTSMLCCQARSSWVSFVVYSLLIIVYCIYKRDKKLLKRIVLLLICFSIIFILIDISKNHRLTSRVRDLVNESQKVYTSVENNQSIDKSAGSGRIEIWGATLEVIKDHPIVGCGVDALGVAMFREQLKWHANWIEETKTCVDKAHNEYLQIAATEGIPAVVIYLSFVTIVLLQNSKSITKDRISLVFTLVIISYLVQAFFNISTIGVAPLFWMILGLNQNEEFKQYANKKLDT